MDSFIGTWNLVESENFEAFLKQVGVPKDKIPAGDAGLPRQVVVEKTNKGYKFSSLNAVKNMIIEFEPGKEFDLGPTKSVIVLEGGKMIQTQKGGKATRVERWVEGDKLFATGECEGVTYKQVYQRA